MRIWFALFLLMTCHSRNFDAGSQSRFGSRMFLSGAVLLVESEFGCRHVSSEPGCESLFFVETCKLMYQLFWDRDCLEVWDAPPRF